MASSASGEQPYLASHPDENGYFGRFGGSFLPPHLQQQMDEIKNQYLKIRDTPEFLSELNEIRKNYQGRPTPLQYAKRLSESLGGGKSQGVEIYLKREDLNHTGAHKLNHCVSTWPLMFPLSGLSIGVTNPANILFCIIDGRGLTCQAPRETESNCGDWSRTTRGCVSDSSSILWLRM